MKVKEYPVIERAVTEGVLLGIRRFYKHRDVVPEDIEQMALAEKVAEHVMAEICEWVTLEGDHVCDATD